MCYLSSTPSLYSETSFKLRSLLKLRNFYCLRRVEATTRRSHGQHKKDCLKSSNQIEANRNNDGTGTRLNDINVTDSRISYTIKQVEPSKRTGAEYRMKKTQHSMLSQKIVAVMTEYNRMQNDYREKCKQRIQRQLEISMFL